MGIVARRAGSWHTSNGGSVDAWIDVDTSLPRGFSGGPLLAASGEVIGLNTASLTPRGAVLPHATVARVVARLEEHGTAAPGYLGVGFYPGTLPEDLAADVGQAEALMAVSLEPGGPGEAAGLLVGDALIHIDGQSVTGLRQLVGVLGAKGAGAEVELTVVRAGSTHQVTATLGARKRRRHWHRR
jgi:S1-C subfamily serine protease